MRIKTPLVPPMHFSARKIGLFGGSFNPPHIGHMLAAQEVMRRLKLDQIWFLITPGNPLKSQIDLPSTHERYLAVQKLIQSFQMKTLTLEENLGTSYTSVLVSYLRGRYPRCKFVWIMGADNFAKVHLWYDWKYLIEHIPLVIVDRPHWRFIGLSSPCAHRLSQFRVKEEFGSEFLHRKAPAWVFLKNKKISTSSTLLRMKTGNNY